MNSWRKFPLIRMTLPVLTGMITGIFFETSLKFPLTLLGIFFLVLGFLIFSSKTFPSYSFRWVTGILIFLLTVILSNRIAKVGQDSLKYDYFGNFKTIPSSFIGEIIEPVIQKQKSSKVIMRIIYSKEKAIWYKTEGTALVFIGKSPGSQLLCYGDRLLISAQFAEPDGPLNPGGFDNRRYLKLKGIYRQAYVNPNHWRLISSGNRNPVLKMALLWRDEMLMILRQSGMKGREFAVAGALLLGYVDEVDNDLMQDYSATGVIHILSVSGMHVGMVFLVLDKLLAFLEKRKYGNYGKTLFIILFIWLYAFITGLSPAVMRAAAMLSLMVFGKARKQLPDIMNILAASAIFLLVCQPLLLTDIGFQLSYMAVAGIVILYKPIHGLFVPSSGFLDKIWSIMAVSIAAQLGTLPLCLYYFHQFPNYFLFTNIIVIPLSNLIIYSGIVTLGIGKILFISHFVACVFSFMVWFLNTFIHWMSALPLSVTRGISITFIEAILLYLVMITGIVFISGKKKLWLFITLSLMIVMSCSFLVGRFIKASKRIFIVYDIKGSGLIDLTTGGKSILVGNLSVLKDPYFLETFKKARWNSKVTGLFEFQYPMPLYCQPSFHYGISFYIKKNFICFGGKKIALINSLIPKAVVGRLEVDYLVISGNFKGKLVEIVKNIKPRAVIFDASNSLKKVREWMKESRLLGIRCYSVSLSGAFCEEF